MLPKNTSRSESGNRAFRFNFVTVTRVMFIHVIVSDVISLFLFYYATAFCPVLLEYERRIL